MAYGDYVGSYSSLDPREAESYKEVFRGQGYSLATGKIGATTSIQTANQIAEVEARLKEGMKTVEVSMINPQVLESIPKSHFKEIGQLAKLSGAEITMHAPIIDPSGFTQQGWSERNREEAEREFTEAIKKAHEMNEQGNIPVTIHASSIPANEWRKSLGKDYKDSIVVVNPETGELRGMPREERYSIGENKPRLRSPEERLNEANASHWGNTLIQIADIKRHGDAILNDTVEKIESKKIPIENAGGELRKVDMYYDEVGKMLASVYDNARKAANKETEKTLIKVSNEWKEQEEKIENLMRERKFDEALAHKRQLYDGVIGMLQTVGYPTQESKDKRFGIQFYKPVEEFAIEHASETFGNVAWNAYNQFGNKAPIISIENEAPNTAFGRAEKLRELIKKSREQFVEKAVASKKLNRDDAERISENIIGATWDTGHIALLKKAGFGNKDIIEETKKIAPYVKHVHLNDNFGMEHSDLPPGMGNAPLKEIMAELEKNEFAGKTIIEGGNFVSQFKVSPHPYSLESLRSPIYTPATEMEGSWDRPMSDYGTANMGYGEIFPQQHFSMYGAGFSGLPTSLGGVAGKQQSRFSGAPIE